MRSLSLIADRWPTPSVRRAPAERRPGSARAPGPSKIAYRLSRAWKKSWVRVVVLIVMPAACAAGVIWQIAMTTDLARMGSEVRARLVDGFSARPEFAVTGLSVTGATLPLLAEVRNAVGPLEGSSSLTVNVAALKARIEALGSVASAQVVLDTRGTLRVAVVERKPAALWRRGPRGEELVLVGLDGVVIGQAAARRDHPYIPLLLGRGAQGAVGEAINLLEGLGALKTRVRALVRVGERRWDVVLENDMKILLPEEAPAEALAGLVTLQDSDKLLDRDIAVVDLRVPERPTVGLQPGALERVRLRKAVSGDGERT